VFDIQCRQKDPAVKMQLIVPPNSGAGVAGTETQAVRAGNLVFVGGQMSLDEQGRITGTDIAT